MSRIAYQHGRVFVGRLPKGADLVASITRIANEEGIKAGTVAVHGMVSSLALTTRNGLEQVVPAELGELLEIAGLGGTVSQFKGRSMARIDGAFVRSDGSMTGGLVALGTAVHACELVLTELLGGTLSRDFDPETGLSLWRANTLLIES